VVALVRGSGQQQQIARVVTQRLGELVVLGLADLAAVAIGGQMMRLVEHHQIPGRRLLQAFDARRSRCIGLVHEVSASLFNREG
jgi:hypothetical protein